eukprot:gnl/Spiro4/28566_TR14126_c0_g1_i1.p1 gnl/Spiro4/28566_TR14126_c0_g1~~gnl/Spiro4/28566_TR14126_c0_g1_i1.p1  ORF type:complete len:262 (-),score=0.05 gnl/Spiro4/28566_TR14126_c0_g1_i1:82-867(-)
MPDLVHHAVVPAKRHNAVSADVAAAACAAFGVSFPVTIIDRAVVKNTSGVQRLWPAARDGLRELLEPTKFLRKSEYWMIFGVYTVTYVAANCTDSYCTAYDYDATYPKLTATTLVNTAAAATKDRTFARMFGSRPPVALPKASWALFFVRDLMTMTAAFNLPTPIANKLVERNLSSRSVAHVVSQIAPVCLIQFLSVPLHLLAYDLYNYKVGECNRTWLTRARFIRGEYLKTLVARSCRVFPAFGIGGLGNTWLRNGFSHD